MNSHFRPSEPGDYRPRIGRCGHSFSWCGEEREPPPDTPCRFCGQPFSAIGFSLIHFCLSAYAQSAVYRSWTRALQGPE